MGQRRTMDDTGQLALVARKREIGRASTTWHPADSRSKAEQQHKYEEALANDALGKAWARKSSRAEAIRTLRNLVTELQLEYDELIRQALDEGDRCAT